VNFRDWARAGWRPANSVVYVADGNSGNVAAYGVPWDPTKAGAPQTGKFVLIAKAPGRTVPVGGPQP
jgi:hypothetical protein